MSFRQRDLLLVPIPFSDLSRRKLRPVVVLSNDLYNMDGPDVLVVAITSNLAGRTYAIPLDSGDLEQGTMRRASVVRTDKVFSIDQRIVVSQFGRVSVRTFDLIRHNIMTLLEPAPRPP